VLLTERAAPVDQQSQDLQLFVGDDGPQSGHAGADQGDGVRVGGVGLASLSGGEHPCSGGQLRWDVDDVFAVGQKPDRDVLADPRAPLDGPDPVGPLAGVAPHLVVAITVSGEPTPAEDGLVGGHHLDRRRALVRVHPDDDSTCCWCAHVFLRCSNLFGCRAGRATLLRAGQTPLEPLLALAAPGSRRPNESHTTSVGSRNESDDPGAWTEPRQAPVLGQ
jgi:hypothetical protein